jgi:hypothetical protein
MNINQQLAELYAGKWANLCHELDKDNCDYQHNPLLLYIKDPEDFESADIKIMLFGQDMSWGDWYQYDRKSDLLTSCMPVYKHFDNKKGSIDAPNRLQTKGMGGGMNLFIKMFNENFKENEVRYVWNNLVKIGRNTRGGDLCGMQSISGKLYNIERTYFDVIMDEINIIQPHILLFFTGPNTYWENKLQERFAICKDNYNGIPNWTLRQVAKLDLNRELFPSVKFAFRTYHPCARMSKKTRYSAIINEINL